MIIVICLLHLLGFFVRQKVQKAQKTDFCNPRSVNFQHFPHFPNSIVLKMRKVQIPHNAGNMINLNAMVFVDFVAVALISP